MDSQFYTVTGYKSFRAFSAYNVAITTHHTSNLAELKVGIRGKSNDKIIYDNYKNIVAMPFSTQLLPLTIENIPMADYVLYAEGIKGMVFENEIGLNFNRTQFNVFVQADKRLYKPEDDVKFRVLVLDGNLKGTTVDKDFDVSIFDPNQNQVKEWKNIYLKNGVFSACHKLSSEPIFGSWNISVGNDEFRESQTFEVCEYILPNFEITINALPKVPIKDGRIIIVVETKYTTGQPVKGEATITAMYRNWRNNTPELKLVKTFRIDGKSVFILTMEELKITEKTYLYLNASIKEDLTKKVQSAKEIDVIIVKNKFDISFQPRNKTIKPGLPFLCDIFIKHIDETPITDITIPLKLLVSIEQQDDDQPNVANEIELNLNQNGMASFEMDMPDDAVNVKCVVTYMEEEKTFQENVTSDFVDSYIQTEVITKNPQINQEIEINVHATESLEYFTYQIIGRGEIFHSETVRVPNEKSGKFTFFSTPEMSPKIYIQVFYIKTLEKIISDCIEIEFPINFQNQIEMRLTKDVVGPNGDVDILVKANPYSYVGLLAVDQSVLLLNSNNDLDGEHILQSLSNYESSFIFNYDFMLDFPSFYTAQSLLLTNVRPLRKEIPVVKKKSDVKVPSRKVSSQIIETAEVQIPVHMRKDFPETWFFENIEDSGPSGKIILHKKVPDTITSWIISGFAVDPYMGYGMISNPLQLQVFRPFFITPNLPYSIKCGESIEIPILIFNYMSENFETEVFMNNKFSEFDFVIGRHNDLKRTRKLIINSHSSTSISFFIRPKVTGYITINVAAVTSIAGDCIQQQLLVESDGITKYKNKSFLIDLRDKCEDFHDILIDIPKYALENSINIEISVMGDLLGTTINNIQKLINLPNGCGEQNMLNIVPHVKVLDYLKLTNQLTFKKRQELIQNIELGYQNQLGYKHSDGCYSTFGPSISEFGSTWLTAFVVKCFRQAAKYIFINEDTIKESFEFLCSVQSPNGSFSEIGQILQKDIVSNDELSISLTAYVLTAFLQSKNDMKLYGQTIDKAIDYLVVNFDKINDVYPLAISTYALQLAGCSQHSRFFDKFNSLAKRGNNFIWWEKEKSNTLSSDIVLSFNVELTAYGLLTYFGEGRSSEAVPIVNWLVEHRNAEGGFGSTQDTIIAIEAITCVGLSFIVLDRQIEMSTFSSDTLLKKFDIDNKNSNVIQSHLLPSSVDKIKIKSIGHGFAVGQISYKYNTESINESKHFKIDVQVEQPNPDSLQLNVQAKYITNPEENDLMSNMALIEVKFPSGFILDIDTITTLREIQGVKKVETRNCDTTVVFYFENLTEDLVELNILGLRTHRIIDLKPTPIIVYDYYDNSRNARIFYSIPKNDILSNQNNIDNIVL